MNINLKKGDCLELFKDITDNSIDLILCDPPYGTIKGMAINKSGEKGNEWDDIINIDKMFFEINRVLKENAKCILFCQEPFTFKLLSKKPKSIDFNYKMIWDKKQAANILGCKKSMTNQFEEILLFTKPLNIYNHVQNHPLREYAEKLQKYINLTISQFKKIYGNSKQEHFLHRTKTSQFAICTEDVYNILIRDFKINELDYFIDYEDLKKIDKEFKDSLNLKQNVFNLWEGGKQKTNLLSYKKDNLKLHPTQKPVALLEDLIKTFTNENMTVLDFTMGSGSTGVACVNTKRNFIGFEKDDVFFNIAKKRIEECNNKKPT